MRRTQHALVALIAAAVLVALAAPAWAASSRSFSTGSKQVRAGQLLKVSGKGCRSRALVRIYLSGRRIESFDANSQGRFSELVEIPGSTDDGDHWIKAACSGHYLGVVKIVVLRSRFSVRPRTVEPGGHITVSGSGCPAKVWFVVRLDGEVVESGRTSSGGRFVVGVDIPDNASEDVPHRVSARCHGEFVGSQLIEVVDTYPTQQSLLTTDRTAVPAGQSVTVSGTKCPTGQPAASLDGRPVALNLNRSVKGEGFTATVTIPAAATQGRHTLWAGCDAGSAGTTELQVGNATEPAAARMAFGPPPLGNLTLGASLFAGIAFLVTSVGIGIRRRP
jgi:hypothetical protein